MGTVFALRVEGDVDASLLAAIHDWWRDVESRFSTFRSDSQVSRIGLGELPIEDADADVRHVLAMCAELEEATGGIFSIRPGRPGGPGIDPAAYVKGWSVDEAALVLRSAGRDDFVIYAGGDVLCSGRTASGEAWRVGVRDPADQESVVAAIELARGAVATSGAYERGSHVWGATAGLGLGSVTVMGRSLGMADALATALFAGGASTPMGWFGSYPGFQALLVGDDGSLSTLGSPQPGFTIIA